MLTLKRTRRVFGLITGLAMLAILALGSIGTAFADSPTLNVQGAANPLVSVDGGDIAVNGGTDPSLANTNQTVNIVMKIHATDLTGTGKGWTVSIQATHFAAGSHALPTMPSMSSIGSTTDVGSGTFTDPSWGTNMAGSTVLPDSAATDPTQPAATLLDASANSGMGEFKIPVTFQQALPSNAYAGNYSSTFTITIAPKA